MLEPNSGNVAKYTKYNGMDMPNLSISTKCDRVQRDLVALFTKCYEIKKQKQWNFTK